MRDGNEKFAAQAWNLGSPVCSVEKDGRKGLSVGDLCQLFQTPRTSHSSNVNLGILLYFKMRHIIVLYRCFFLIESSDNF